MTWMRVAAGAALAVACAQTAHEFRDADPASGPTAQVVLTNPFYDEPFDFAQGMVHISERAADCATTYLGSVNVRAPEQPVRIGAERAMLFELSVSRMDAYTCTVGIGFTPRADRRYRLSLRDGFGYRCLIDVHDETGEPVAAFDPQVCEPGSSPSPLSARSGSPGRSSLSIPRPSIRP